MRRLLRSGVFVTAAVGALAFAGGARGAVPLTQVLSDPFANPDSQHQTVAEPDTFAFGSTLVAAAQTGRFTDGGSSGIGWSTLSASGAVVASGTLPGITPYNGGGGSFARVSDPSVAYDAAHGVWLISSIPLTASVTVPAVLVSRSTNNGATWGPPVTAATSGTADLDKNWTACDNHPASPFYGHCYTTYDDHGNGNRLLVTTSTNGGLTWGAPKQTADAATGLGGQPVVTPSGRVIIPAANANESAIIAFSSTDGGQSWGRSASVTRVSNHPQAGNLRSGPLPTAEISDDGTAYVAWQDCRFRRRCSSDDILYSTSADGLTWSAVKRVPIDPTTSSVDHFLPGLAVTGSGTATRLALTYYFYRQAACGSGCSLEVGFVASNDGGGTWSAHTDVAGPFSVSLTPNTTQGRMVGDYISTSFLAGKAFGAFAVARAPSGGLAFNQALFVPAGGLVGAAGTFVSSSSGDHVVAGGPTADRPAPIAYGPTR